MDWAKKNLFDRDFIFDGENDEFGKFGPWKEEAIIILR